MFEGIGQLAAKNRAGHKCYLLGEVRDTGWWYFFPVALAVKTPIAFLLLLGIGAVAAARAPPGVERGRQLVPLLIACALLLVCLPSRINIGLRHVLPMYPFLAITAGSAWRVFSCRRGRPGARRSRRCASRLAAARVFAAIPTTSAYFNELAGQHPERILVDSDLDDGQDLRRLADTLRARHVPVVWLAYAGSATVAEHGLPPVRLGYFTINGDLFNLPAGPVSFALGLEYRGERLDINPSAENTTFDTIGSSDFEAFRVNRDVWATYQEVRFPVTSPAWNFPGAYSLEFDIAEREEWYSQNTSATTVLPAQHSQYNAQKPKFSVRWQPLDPKWIGALTCAPVTPKRSMRRHCPTLVPEGANSFLRFPTLFTIRRD